MRKLFWFASFLLDLLIFVVSGLGMMLFTLIVGFFSILVDLVIALSTFDGAYIASCFITLFRLFTEYPAKTFEILWRRIKKSYKKPVIFTLEENEENVNG